MVKFVLGSGSKSRLSLIRQINFEPDIIDPANIDETPLKKEKPLDYIKRIALTKAETLHEKYYGDVILCADTIVNYQSKIIQKCHTDEEIRDMLKNYSGRNIKVITAVYMITRDNKRAIKVIESNLKFKHLSKTDIDEYVEGGYGRGTAGGIVIESMMDSFVRKIVGSYSNIMGLPLYETRNMLISAGIKPMLVNKNV